MAASAITAPTITKIQSVLAAQNMNTEKITLKSEDFDTLVEQLDSVKEAIDNAVSAVRTFNQEVFNTDVWTDENAAGILSERNEALNKALEERSSEVETLKADVNGYKAEYERINEEAAGLASN